MTILCNNHDLPECGTLAALRAFVDSYERATGRRVKVHDLARDLYYLREVLEAAILCDLPELYSATDQLVMALRAAPLPANRPSDNRRGCVAGKCLAQYATSLRWNRPATWRAQRCNWR